MGHQLLPSRMSLPEVMGDPCASELREHAEALLVAITQSRKLVRSHPTIESDLCELRDGIERSASRVLSTLAEEAGVPPEGGSIAPGGPAMGDYRIDRASGCWIWMRSVTRQGYPVVGRKANGRENRPAKILWMLAHGPLSEHEIVVRTCNMRLCVNPDHARVTDRREHGAERMREESALDWDAVREIRVALCSSRNGLRERVAEFAERFGVGESSILDVFRNKAWKDADYEPGFEVRCAGPGCDVVFRTTNTARKYHSPECRDAAMEARGSAGREWERRSPERQAREDAALRAEAAAAEAEWADVGGAERRTSVWSVASIDQPCGDSGSALQEVLATSSGADDPAIALERKATRELLDGLTEEDVEAMDESELACVRARLRAGDVLPATSSAVAT